MGTTMASYSRLDDDCSDDFLAHSTGGAHGFDIFSPRHTAADTHVAPTVVVATPVPDGGSNASDGIFTSDARDKCEVFSAVCTALDPSEDPAANELLQELKRDLERVRAELQTRASLATEEHDLMDCLEQLELVTDGLEVYRQKAQVYHPPSLPSLPAAVSGIESELRDLLGVPGATPQSAATQQPPQVLAKTKSEQDFDNFFAQQSKNPVFSPHGLMGTTTISPCTPKAVRAF